MTPNALVLTGRIARADVPGLCAELEALIERGPDAGVIDCDVGGVVRPDLAVVEAIGRLALAARRAGGRRLRLRGTPDELQRLLDLVGLGEVVGLAEDRG
ncbi:STAS domain-containing protein [Streptomyces sp. NPDC056465]